MRSIWRAVCLSIALICTLTAAIGESSMNAYEQYLSDGTLPSLREHYEDDFLIGVAVPAQLLKNQQACEVIAAQFSSMTCENEMKPDFSLDRNETIRQGDPERAVVYPGQAKTALKFAQDHGLKLRGHTLVWHSQTPRWFFAENWSNNADAPLVDRETMLRRMENYIHDMMDWVNTRYPGVVYAWDVVNEAIEPAHGHPDGLRTEDSLWYQVVGEDFIEQAFAFARKYAAPDQLLFYNDYNCYQKNKIGPLRSLLKKLRDQGNLDGLGLQSHLGADSPSLMDYENALTVYGSLDITLHITELDINTSDDSLLGQMRLAVRYRTLFALLERLKEKAGLKIDSVTVWGLTDDRSWLNKPEQKAYPLLFNGDFTPKPAFFGALQDPSIPTMAGEAKLQEAIERLQLNQPAGEAVQVLKPLSQHNPVMAQHFGADPWAMVYDGRVYLYMTGDEPVFGADGKIQTNTYGNINTLRVISSDDLVNWQDHGAVRAAGRQGAAPWAANSWAPCAAWKTIDGKDRFFLYFANSGGGIGVLTSDSPTGPFTDPLGHALISRATPTCDTVTWLFDPAVLVDEDGSAYLYFGGGIPDGMQSAPGTARVVKLGADMISLDGDPQVIDAPWLFEDSGINRIGDTYLYSYCTNFQVPASGSEQGFSSGEIVYMTSKQPMGPFTGSVRVLKNPGTYFGVGGNNHHCMFQFDGKWYITYHAATIDRDLGWNAGYRSTFVDTLSLDENGLPTLTDGTMAGVTQLKSFDPYRTVEAETLASLAGAEALVQVDASAGVAIRSTAEGGWLGVAGVDFGDQGASQLTLTWRSPAEAAVSVVLDDPAAEPAATLTLSPAETWEKQTFTLPAALTGVHDLYLRLDAAGVLLDTWHFGRTEPVSQALYTLTGRYGFKLGAPLSFQQLFDTRYLTLLKTHFNSMTATNEMKAYSMLDERASRRATDGMPVINYTMADQMVAWAQQNGIGVRGHVLVWDAYMSDWYFHEDFDSAKPYADQETVRQRTEYYITQVITHFEEKFPGVVYCWDVVNEAVGDSAGEYAPGDPRHLRTLRSGAPNGFREYMGEDYVAQAFLYARNAVDALGADIRLYYNDYNAFFPEKRDAILGLAQSVNSYITDESGQPRHLLDGIGMQGYIGGYGTQEGCLDDSLLQLIEQAITAYADAGYEVQITEMAVRNFDLSQQERHAAYYADLFRVLMGVNSDTDNPLKAVSIWGLTDNNAPKGNYVYNLNSPYGGLWDLQLREKEALRQVDRVLREGLAP